MSIMNKQMKLICIFIGCTVVGVILRFVFKFAVLEPETGFFPIGSVSATVFPLVMAVLVLTVIVSGYLLIRTDEIYTRSRWQSTLLGIGLFFFAFSLMLVTAVELVSTFGAISTGELYMVDTYAQLAFSLFSTLCAIICAYQSVSIATGSYTSSPVSTLIPVIWQLWYLILVFLRDTNAIHVSEQYLRLGMLCASLVSFYYFNRQFSDTWSKKMAPASTATSLSASMLAFVIVIPALFSLLISGGYNFSLPELMLYLSLGILWLTFGLYIFISKNMDSTYQNQSLDWKSLRADHKAGGGGQEKD